MNKMEKIIAIIPARSGSKGLPGKNIKLLAGQPLLSWVIQAAKSSGLIDRVICSTDSEEYATIARHYGAETPFLRPAEFATDSATDIMVLTHAVNWLKENENYVPDIILRIQPTNPTFTTKYIDEGISLLLNDQDADSVRAITPCHKHPYKMWKFESDRKYITPFLNYEFTGLKEGFNMGRQALPEVFLQVGVMEVLRYNTLINKKSMAGEKVIALNIQDEKYTIDIDTEVDFILAEIILKQIKNKENN
jgi:CMP-N,N'-diacetyllegionaminic acid synthase